MPQYASFCTQCGTALSGEVRFCTNCGSAVAEAPAESAAPQPGPSRVAPPATQVPPVPAAPLHETVPTSAPVAPRGSIEARTRAAVPVWLIAVGAVLLVVGAIGGTVLVLGGGDDKKSSKDGERPSASSTGPSAAPTEASDPVEYEEEPEEAEVSELKTCWEASRVASWDQCPEPTGRAGLRWVFASLGDGYSCQEPFDPDKVFQRGCLIDVPGYGATRFAFSEWPDTGSSVRHYNSKFRGPAVPTSAGHLRWGPEYTRGSHQISIAFANHPFSVSIIADSNAHAEAAADILRMRSDAELP